MAKERTWIIVVGTAAILEHVKSFAAICWSGMRSLRQPWVFAFSLTALDMALEALISLAWVAVVFYWILRTSRVGSGVSA